MKAKLQKWYAEQVDKQLKDDEGIQPVDMRLSIMKSLSAQWLLSMYDSFKVRQDVLQHGFERSGITDCLKGQF